VIKAIPVPFLSGTSLRLNQVTCTFPFSNLCHLGVTLHLLCGKKEKENVSKQKGRRRRERKRQPWM
jgi:hypothetical protein